LEISGEKTMTVYYTQIESPLGPLLLTSDGTYLTGLFMKDHKTVVKQDDTWLQNESIGALEIAAEQLQLYFSGQLKQFNVPLKAEGTDFQKQVWRELCNIDYGTTISYGELARRIGNPKAFRAVGLANGQNPISIIVPCHRVIGSNGNLTGYGGGLPRKVMLLELEKSATVKQLSLLLRE
jgi:methylated-DNA-[protein]-cysteine S-methyltransferase